MTKMNREYAAWLPRDAPSYFAPSCEKLAVFLLKLLYAVAYVARVLSGFPDSFSTAQCTAGAKVLAGWRSRGDTPYQPDRRMLLGASAVLKDHPAFSQVLPAPIRGRKRNNVT